MEPEDSALTHHLLISVELLLACKNIDAFDDKGSTTREYRILRSAIISNKPIYLTGSFDYRKLKGYNDGALDILAADRLVKEGLLQRIDFQDWTESLYGSMLSPIKTFNKSYSYQSLTS